MKKPLLLLDIDGVISLFGFDPARPPAGRFLPVEGILHFLSASAGDHLRALADAYELAWCSGWEEKANDHLPAALGLSGPLPHVCFDSSPTPAGTSAHWKLAAIDAYAGPTRPLAWVDDAHNESTARWAAGRTGPTLLIPTEPPIGLTEAHVSELLAWARALGHR